MMILLLAMQVAPMAEMKTTIQTTSVEEGVASFKRICFDPFPAPAATLAAIEDPALGFVRSPKTPLQAMQPGDRWTSAKAVVTYVDAPFLPADFGSPQCSVTVALDGNPPHGQAAAALSSNLALPTTKIGKDGAKAQTMWDIPQTNGDKWRVFLTTEQTPNGSEMQMNIMNLRGKKKK